MTRFDYVTVGHVTVDLISADDSRRPGGGAFYSALQAARLGLRTLILTKGRPDELQELLTPYRHELEVQILPAEHTTTLATSSGGARRRQRLLAWAGAIEESFEVDTVILHLAAVARETPSRWRGTAEFVGATPQGLMRAWDSNPHDGGLISLVPLDPHDLPQRLDALVVSDTERPYCQQALATLSGDTAVAITAGSEPTTVILPDGTVQQVPVPASARPHDDLGAGDVFAAAFFVALHRGDTPAAAAAYGNAAAAVRIAGDGPQAIGDRAAIALAS